MAKKIIPLAPVERLIRTASDGDIRVSESARGALTEILERIGIKIAKEAIIETKHAGRKTVKAEDINRALDILKLE
ncbi:MAG: NFYB/HAP3 family transcription factor subunit [Methanosarcinales archaeon]|nr:NFYB/HAP3 family transcription factor subunit [Methanosarcinales archaeon]HDJ38168.1 histone [Methanosarcinales archaeon]